MILNSNQIRSRSLVSGAIEKNFRGTSYDIRAGKILDMHGKNHESFTVSPQGMAFVISEETISLPSDITGLVHIKTSLSTEGILAINIGLIDPLFNGPISTLLINFGSRGFELKNGLSVLRITFHRSKDLPVEKKTSELKQVSISHKNAEADRKLRILARLGETFLNLDRTTDKIAEKVSRRSVGTILFIITTAGVVMTLAAILIAGVSQYFFTHLDPYRGVGANRDRIESIEKRIRQLERANE